MTNPDVPNQQIQALQERFSTLCGAIQRISESLDLDTVLQEIVDSACTLTGARYGGITIMDEAGQLEQFVTAGLTAEQHRRLLSWDGGPRLFEHLCSLGPFRVGDFAGYVQSLGFNTDAIPYRAGQGAPIHHEGLHLGTLFVSHAEAGREFTDEDEELLRLFAAQAATTIANAGTYRDEQQARAKLEALVDTSPVGVAVFDARTGGLVSINRETQRIVDNLLPNRSAKEVLEAMTWRRTDGTEVALTEIPLTLHLNTGKTVRNEEIVLSVPGGGSVKTLVNVTPIRARGGRIESVVVTVQDLAPFEELERMRTEFLAIVSHELRTPLTSIKGSTATVLGSRMGLAPAEMLQFFRIIDGQADHMSALIGDLLDVGRIATGMLSVSPEPSAVAELVDRARNTFLSGGSRHTVLVELPPKLPRVAVDRQRFVQVLNNLFANAARHSPASSPIRVTAACDGLQAAISVTDRGRGIAPDRLPHLFEKYAGAGDGEPRAGHGLGLAICKGLVEAHGGRIWATSGGEGQGSRFTFTVPLAAEAAGAPAGAADPEGRAAAREKGPEPTRVLVVDDDPQALLYARDALTNGGFSAVVTGDHRELPDIIRAEEPHLVLLDLMLPGIDGIKLMEEISELADLPVIFVSAYGRVETMGKALEAGAADYIIKPFSPTELTARIRAALRKRAEPPQFTLGELAIDYARRRVTVAGRPVELTVTEYELLRLLSVNQGRALSYRTMLRRAWKKDKGYVDPKLVHAVVKRLRGKLGEDTAEPAYILNERGVGYRMPGAAASRRG